MLKASTLFPADFWSDSYEVEQYKSYMGDNWLPPADIGHNNPPAPRCADPLAKLTPWHLFIDCVWISDEDTNTKIMLLCVARFMDKQLRGSSMSYRQIASDCGFGERTAKRCAKKVRERWLRIKIGKGRYVAGKGSENLYYGRVPPDVLDKLRERELLRRKSGVSQRHPEADYGVSDGHPEDERGDCVAQAGCPAGTLTPHTPHKEEDISRNGSDGQPSHPTANGHDGGPIGNGSGAAGWATTPSKAEIAAGFEEWWQRYPRKEDKRKALKAYTARVTDRDSAWRATIPQLLAALKAFRFSSDPKFIKYPASWLNAASWTNESSQPKPLRRYCP